MAVAVMDPVTITAPSFRPAGSRRSVAEAGARVVARCLRTETARSAERAAVMRLMIAEGSHSWYGPVQLDDEEIERLVTGGVRIRLRAFRAPGQSAKSAN